MRLSVAVTKVKNRFLTPDLEGSGIVCKRLSLPFFLWKYVNGALGELLHLYRWEQFGSMTPSEVAAIFYDAFDNWERGCMVGSVVAFYRDTVPDGFLLCDGSSHLVADYPKLAAILPDVALSGSDFSVPNLVARFVVGEDVGGGLAVGTVGGEKEHVLTVGEMPAHVHEISGATASVTTTVIPDAPDAIATPMPSGSTGGGLPHNNLPPYFVLIYGINTGV